MRISAFIYYFEIAVNFNFVSGQILAGIYYFIIVTGMGRNLILVYDTIGGMPSHLDMDLVTVSAPHHPEVADEFLFAARTHPIITC